MRHSIRCVAWILLCTILILTTASCVSKEEKTLAVSIAPLKGLAEAVAGDSWKIHIMVPEGESPANYEPTIDDMIYLEEAEVVFHLSIPSQATTLDKLQKNNPDKLITDLSAECAALMEPIHITDSQLDPHLWLSPKRAILLSENILDTMIDIDPEQADTYRKNQKVLAAELKTLDMAWENTLKNSSPKTFLIYHPALSYLSLDYGLDMVSVEQHGKEPNLKDLNTTIQLALEKEIETVFYQREFPKEKVEALAREIGASPVPLSLLEEDYMDMMYELLSVFEDTIL